MQIDAPSPWLPLAAFVIVTLSLYAWGRWVSRRHGTLVFRLAARGVLLGAVLTLTGAALAMHQLPHTDDAASPSTHNAESYARSVSGAFGTAAWPVALGNLLLLACVVVLAVGTARRPRADSEPKTA
jgi:hypothetical protein